MEDVNVLVNLLTSCMLRELRGWLGYIYTMYTYESTLSFRYINMYINICIHIHLFFIIIYVYMYISYFT